MEPECLLTWEEHAAYQELLCSRLQGSPIAHLLGEREFWSLSFYVTPHTLIPRPDTETLVEQALAHLPYKETASALDLGTGTGCIAVALAHERPNLVLGAVESEPIAAAVAQANIARHGFEARIRVHLGSWFQPVAGRRYTVIVSNPPYLAPDDPALKQGDVAAEPRSALVAGENGLATLRWIIQEAPLYLEPGGWLVVEIGGTQGETVQQEFEQTGFEAVSLHRDYGGYNRVVVGRRPSGRSPPCNEEGR